MSSGIFKSGHIAAASKAIANLQGHVQRLGNNDYTKVDPVFIPDKSLFFYCKLGEPYDVDAGYGLKYSQQILQHAGHSELNEVIYRRCIEDYLSPAAAIAHSDSELGMNVVECHNELDKIMRKCTKKFKFGGVVSQISDEQYTYWLGTDAAKFMIEYLEEVSISLKKKRRVF